MQTWPIGARDIVFAPVPTPSSPFCSLRHFSHLEFDCIGLNLHYESFASLFLLLLWATLAHTMITGSSDVHQAD